MSIVDWNIQADEAGKSIFEIFVDLSSGSVSQTSFSLTVLFNILTSLRINYLVVDPSFTAVSVFVFRVYIFLFSPSKLLLRQVPSFNRE